MTAVRLEKISKHFGPTIALDDINLQIAAGELFFLLGPSGCGKSTLLRLIAGLGEPTSGRIFFNNEDVTSLPTQARNAVMCFQSYALWPHMSAAENIRFGLAVRGLSAAEQNQRVDEALALVQMKEYGQRKPNELSGGQQQRVALARAMAVRPACLLLDEPLSNLDAKLRNEMRSEIRRICKSSGYTTIYVTHDQKEALSIADRIALLKEGRLAQIGSPGELYQKPRNRFVADFIGNTNLISATITGRNGNRIELNSAAGPLVAIGEGEFPRTVTVSIRPEQMEIVSDDAPPNGRNRLTGKTLQTTFLGEASEHVLLVNDARLRVISAPPIFNPPQHMKVEFDPEDVVVLTE
ncbi:MAG TPA: ABC transporter ATP-binding protein [Tepidisphaeraceae bacterium]|jgi:iron(III) transport system ATP-binding protein|nr:ABC transporter ATP-binding protein [Tepidisphaeraceae bacterium]